MNANASQLEQVAGALAGAFDRHELAGLAHAEAGVTLDVAADDTAISYATRLVKQADHIDRLVWLILAALRERPDNTVLLGLIETSLNGLFDEKKKPSPHARSRMSEERLDALIAAMGILSGRVEALQSRVEWLSAQVTALQAQMERGQHHYPQTAPHYWTVIAAFIVAGAIIAAAIFYVGAPR